MANQPLVITLDDNVKQTPRKTRNRTDQRLADLQAMEIDTGKNSFFMQGQEKKAARSIIALGRRHGIFLIAREVEVDDIYECHGTRVWRVSEEKMPRQRKVEDEDF